MLNEHLLRKLGVTEAGETYACRACTYSALVTPEGRQQTLRRGSAGVVHARLKASVGRRTSRPFNLG